MIIETSCLKQYLLQHYLSKIYIIIETEMLFLQENNRIILKNLKKNQFIKITKIILNNDSELNKIIQLYQKQEIFFKKKIIIVIFLGKSLTLKQKLFFKNIKNILDQNTICIFHYPNLIFNTICKNFFQKYISKIGLIINNNKNNINNLYTWINRKIKKYKIYFSLCVIKNFLILYNYNLNKINNSLKILSLIYFNSNITNVILKKYYNFFEPKKAYHWINAIVHKKKNIALHILNKLKREKYTIEKLIYYYKNFIYVLLNIKTNQINEKNYNFRNICNYPIQYNFLNSLANHNSLIDIYQAFKILKNIEFLTIKNKTKTIWIYLKILSIIFN
ncbi:hypothetical protein [Buchnera aphidicola]|uniref:hypothetical protein n=1 Tax=Buchnera aphidicola TaxID=9 RepID=UPI00094C8D4C|nr:hypothetical protein [Buchnera aphidicola]